MLAATSAFGADIARPVYKAPIIAAPVFTWTGFYVGGFVGGSSGSEDPTDLNEYDFQGVAGIPRSGTFHNWAYRLKSSFIGGGTVGYNYQIGMWVLGIEGEAGFIRLTGSAPDPNSPGLDVVSSSALGNWYVIGAGRVGYAFDRWLAYVKGGAVFTRESATITDMCAVAPCGPVTIVATGTRNVVKPVVGGGLEYAFTNAWSIKGEYLYWLLNDNGFAVTGVASNGATYSWQHSFSGVHTAKIGINYAFRP
jgi:outer membrane immunogenic protein